jgi:hypothetical protein
MTCLLLDLLSDVLIVCFTISDKSIHFMVIPLCLLYILMLFDFFHCLQVAERALFLWNNGHIEGLIKQNSKVILPIILPALERNTKGHWNQAVQSLSLNVCKIFVDNDPTLFEECRKKFEEDEAQEASMRSKREARWKRLEEIAVSKSSQ